MKINNFTEYTAARIMYKLFSAVDHMHKKHIIHRDLKLDNILYLTKLK